MKGGGSRLGGKREKKEREEGAVERLDGKAVRRCCL